MRVVMDYHAIKEDQITVNKGERVQVLATNQNVVLVHRPANQNSPAAEGWVPDHVLELKESDNGYR